MQDGLRAHQKGGIAMKIITISREFGSGGRELGKRLADQLGFDYYDREIITAIAQKYELDENYVEEALDKDLLKDIPITYGQTLSYVIPCTPYSTTLLLAEQQKVIQMLASRRDCIIVGRSADVILENYDPFRIFIHADMESKIRRCRQRATGDEHLTDRDLAKDIRKVDKARASHHEMFSEIPWGDKRGYDLCINTTGTDPKALVPAIAEYARCWFHAR